MNISNNKIHRNISEDILKLINDDLVQNIPVKQISETYKISKKTIYQLKNGFIPKPRGKPKQYSESKLNSQCKLAVRKVKKTKCKVSAVKILENISEDVSLRSLQYFLKENNDFKLRNIKKKIILNDKNKQQRVKIITSWFNEGIDFNKVIFSDECRFSLDGPDSFLTWDLFDGSDDGNREKRHSGGGGIMVYGLIGSDGFFKLIRVDGSINGEKYLSLMRDTILPMLRDRYNQDFVYQQDNARPHVAKKVLNFFEESNVKVLSWPSRSPDLSIIENVWKILKHDVYDQLEIKNTAELWSRIDSAYQKLATVDSHKIINLYKTVVDRCLKVLRNDGSNKF